MSVIRRVQKSSKITQFQIGFNKAGTTLLWRFFQANEFLAAHGIVAFEGPSLRHEMVINLQRGDQALSSQTLCGFEYFGDFNAPRPSASWIFHKTLDLQYPGSFFILNGSL